MTDEITSSRLFSKALLSSISIKSMAITLPFDHLIESFAYWTTPSIYHAYSKLFDYDVPTARSHGTRSDRQLYFRTY